MTGKEILAQRKIDMVDSDKFSFAVLSLAFVVKRVSESDLVGDELKDSILKDFRRLSRKVRAANRLAEMNDEKRATKCEPLVFRDSHLEGGKRICGTNQQKNSSKNYLSYMRQRQRL